MTTSSNSSSLICTPAPPGARFDISDCRARTLGCSFFPKVPYAEIKRYCGGGYGPYDVDDVFGTITTWVFPLFALLANMHFAHSTLGSLDKKVRFKILDRIPEDSFWFVVGAFYIKHLDWIWVGTVSQLPKAFVNSTQLANPVGTTWTLSIKLSLGQQLWDHCNGPSALQFRFGGEERRNIAHICYCFDDFGHNYFERRVNRLLVLLCDDTVWEGPGPESVDIADPIISKITYAHVKETSRALAPLRVRNIRQTLFIITVYIAGAVGTLLTSEGSIGILDFSLPHTVALRVICFFVFTQLILSSAAGAWSEQWRPKTIMQNFATKMVEVEEELARQKQKANGGGSGQQTLSGGGELDIWLLLAVDEIALWDGGSYVFRPEKFQRSSLQGAVGGEFSCQYWGTKHLFLLIVAFSSLLLAFVASFLISVLTPTVGIGGRSLAELMYVSVWIASFLSEMWLTHEFRGGGEEWRRKQLFYLIWAKDGILSFLVLLFFFLPFIGWYNSGDSWSAYWSLYVNAYINLDLAAQEGWLSNRDYLSCVLVGALVQILVAAGITWRNWDAIKISYSSSDDRETGD